jgi:hypothetical protein
VENGDERFWKEKFHAANGKAQHALMNCTIFFLFEEWVGEKDFLFFPLIFEEWAGEKDFLFFPLIPKLFPNIFPTMFQMVTPQFYPIWFAQSSTPMYINCKDGIQGQAHLFLSCKWGSKRGASIGACPMFQRN